MPLQGSKSFFSEIIASISDISFSRDGRYILSRDYMSLKLWDLAMEARPVVTLAVHEELRPRVSLSALRLCSARVWPLSNSNIYDLVQPAAVYCQCISLHSLADLLCASVFSSYDRFLTLHVYVLA